MQPGQKKHPQTEDDMDAILIQFHVGKKLKDERYQSESDIPCPPFNKYILISIIFIYWYGSFVCMFVYVYARVCVCVCGGEFDEGSIILLEQARRKTQINRAKQEERRRRRRKKKNHGGGNEKQ